MGNWRFLLRLSILVYTFFFIIGCTSSFQSLPTEELDFQKRAQTQVQGNLWVTASVLSADEAEAVFGYALYKRGIQPIWLQIENRGDDPTWFLPFSVDPDYFSPLEVAYPYHRTFDRTYNDQMDQYFLKNAMSLYLAPGSTRSGFVFTNLDLGTKNINVDLVGDDNQPHTFTFFISVPGLRSDHQDVDFNKLYSADQIVSHNEAAFRKALTEMPCCATDQGGTLSGGPMNVVIVAHGEDLLRILIRSGWNETATAKKGSSSIKELSADIPQNFYYTPVAPLYYYGRPQDASFSDPRASEVEHNQLRLWLSPMLFEGKNVWVGQVIREYAEPSSAGDDHNIDLDEVRNFLLQNLWYSQGLKKYGFVSDARSVATMSHPKKTFRGTRYITDGYRSVIWLSKESVPFSDVETADWDRLPKK